MASEEKVDILLTLGGQTTQMKVPFDQKGIFTEAEKLFNDLYERIIAIPHMKNDKGEAFKLLALQLAVKCIELRDSKEDNVLAPSMEKTLCDIEEALEKLEKQQ